LRPQQDDAMHGTVWSGPADMLCGRRRVAGPRARLHTLTRRLMRARSARASRPLLGIEVYFA
jgi:hypothetical protein